MRKFGIGVTVVLVLAFVYVLGFGLRLGSLHVEGFFASQREDIRRDVFENTRSYNQAKISELADYRHQYLTAETAGAKAAIASTVRLRFADYDIDDDRVPAILRDFWREINQ